MNSEEFLMANPEPLVKSPLNSWEGAPLRSQAEESDAPLDTSMQYVLDRLLAKRSKS
jgi:TetR/AcrR family transcriptional regulator, transcriptional repressor for nem operon